MAKILKIHHIAVAVPELEAALAFWRDSLGLPLAGVEEVAGQASQVGMLPIGESEVELVQPTTTDSGIAKYMEKRGPGLHHVCFEVDDLDGMIAALKGKGARFTTETPNSGAGGRRMIFLHPGGTGGVLVELYETK